MNGELIYITVKISSCFTSASGQLRSKVQVDAAHFCYRESKDKPWGRADHGERAF